MATLSLNLAGNAFNYTISAGDVAKVLDRYNPDGTLTGAQVAELIADGFVQSLINDVYAVAADEAAETARAAVVPITITRV